MVTTSLARSHFHVEAAQNYANPESAVRRLPQIEELLLTKFPLPLVNTVSMVAC
jgi:hypothetical protein